MDASVASRKSPRQSRRFCPSNPLLPTANVSATGNFLAMKWGNSGGNSISENHKTNTYNNFQRACYLTGGQDVVESCLG